MAATTPESLYHRWLSTGTPTVLAYVALGSNIEPRRLHIDAAIAALRSTPAITSVRMSPIVETQAVGPGVQGPYLNAAAEVRTTMSARQLLERCLQIEQLQGRDRSREQRWGPRTLDLDLLVYADVVVDEPGLKVPHPRLHERRFVLEPLSEIAADLVIPGLACTVRECLSRLG